MRTARDAINEATKAYLKQWHEAEERRAREHALRHLRPRLRWLIRYPKVLKLAMRYRLWNPPPVVQGGSVVYEEYRAPTSK